MHTTESRLIALAAAGFTGNITLTLGAKGLTVRGSLSRYDSYQNEFKTEATGEGTKGAARLDAIIRAGEAFLDGDGTDFLPVRLPPRSPAPLGGRTAAEAAHDDGLWLAPMPIQDVTEERRKANLPAAAQDDEIAREVNDADREMAF